MLFNSFGFAIFLPIVFLLYWFAANKSFRFQNLLLLVSSYFFYACWDYRFVFLLFFSTFLDYFAGIRIDKSAGSKKKFWLWLSVIINIGFLGFFKYYNFFAESFAAAISHLGFSVSLWTLKIILPVGISFYTFHGLSYVIDIYNDKIKPEKNFINYAVFVSFFPLLVAGPIERARNMLPQFTKARTFDTEKAKDGLRQMLWGFFKKMVIADNCAIYVNGIFSNYHTLNGSTLLLGAFYFSIQIYCDFSGYSDIALGTARLFGFEFMRNFNYPYFSRDIAEFWRKWHISLSSWFRDYVYIPLGGSKENLQKKIRNILIIFLLSGFWHGANWTFLFWGLLNALYFLPLIVFNKNRTHLDVVAKGKLLPTLKEAFKIIRTFLLVMFGWIFFRSNTIMNAFQYIRKIFSRSILSKPTQGIDLTLIIVIIAAFIAEWIQREQLHPLRFNKDITVWKRWAVYYAIFCAIFFLSQQQQTFIYFQF